MGTGPSPLRFSVAQRIPLIDACSWAQTYAGDIFLRHVRWLL
jgi:hypothetical protein